MDEKANRQYKDNAFRFLFKDKKNAVELYNAIAGTNYSADTVKMNMLESALFFGSFRNDVSFTLDDKFVIVIEHQASINPNMPLRCLLYIAELYEQIINMNDDMADLYKAKQMSIETPEFLVLYNGKADFPEKMTLKLSDLFKAKGGREPALELIVTVYNVNKGYNRDIMEQSETLNGYAALIAMAREYEGEGLEKTAALQRAVAYCIKNGILREFLVKCGGEIVRLLQREWNLDDAIRVRVEEKAEDIAEKMLLKNKPIDEIVEFTELTEERILELKKNLKVQPS